MAPSLPKPLNLGAPKGLHYNQTPQVILVLGTPAFPLRNLTLESEGRKEGEEN